nr:hypothetical protein [Helcococcus kunzii]
MRKTLIKNQQENELRYRREFMISLKDFVLRENDIDRNGHIYCKLCGKRVDEELVDLGFTKFIPRFKCEY